MTLTVVAGTAYNAGDPAQATTTIVSDDVPEMRVTGTATIAEGESATVTVTADQAPLTTCVVARDGYR